MSKNYVTLKKYNHRRCDNARYMRIIEKNNWGFRINRPNNPLHNVYMGYFGFVNTVTDRIGYKLLGRVRVC